MDDGFFEGMRIYHIYITTNPLKKVLYIGVTKNPTERLKQHYNNRGKSKTFAGKYYCYNLIYFEEYSDINLAIAREKELKKWSRIKKEKLIDTINPTWNILNAP